MYKILRKLMIQLISQSVGRLKKERSWSDFQSIQSTLITFHEYMLTYFLVFLWVLSLVISVTMALPNPRPRIPPQKRDAILAAIVNKHEEDKKMIQEKKIIELWCMDETFMRAYKPYSHIFHASLRPFFTKAPNRIFPDLVQEFYTNLKIFGKTLTSSVKNVKIIINREFFGRMFKIRFLGTS